VLRLTLQLITFGLLTVLALLWLDRPCRVNCTTAPGQALLIQAAAQRGR
jgi:hypothetical protein